MRMYRAFISTAALFILGALPVAAQNAVSSGTIAGCVRDTSGGVVPGASVRAISEETGSWLDGATDSSGLYTFSLMRVGRYALRVRHDGFKTTEVRNVIVQVGQTATVDVQLAIGALAQQLVVEATAPVFRPSESSVTTVVPHEQDRAPRRHGQTRYLFARRRRGPVFECRKEKPAYVADRTRLFLLA